MAAGIAVLSLWAVYPNILNSRAEALLAQAEQPRPEKLSVSQQQAMMRYWISHNQNRFGHSVGGGSVGYAKVAAYADDVEP